MTAHHLKGATAMAPEHTTHTASDQDTATLFDAEPGLLAAFGADMGLFA